MLRHLAAASASTIISGSGSCLLLPQSILLVGEPIVQYHNQGQAIALNHQGGMPALCIQKGFGISRPITSIVPSCALENNFWMDVDYVLSVLLDSIFRLICDDVFNTPS
jgi:hypothetical protein